MGDELTLLVMFIIIVIVVVYKLTVRDDYDHDIFLGPGTWVVGVDLPAGKGDLVAETGSGDFCIKEKGSKAWGISNKIGVTSGLQPSRFRNIRLHAGDTLEINGNVNIMITTSCPIRNIGEETLGPGNYRFGEDIPVGKYDIEVVSGDGVVYLFEVGKNDYLFFQDMAANNDLKAHSYANLKCTLGHEMWIEGSLQIKLSLSAKQDIWL